MSKSGSLILGLLFSALWIYCTFFSIYYLCDTIFIWVTHVPFQIAQINGIRMFLTFSAALLSLYWLYVGLTWIMEALFGSENSAP